MSRKQQLKHQRNARAYSPMQILDDEDGISLTFDDASPVSPFDGSANPMQQFASSLEQDLQSLARPSVQHSSSPPRAQSRSQSSATQPKPSRAGAAAAVQTNGDIVAASRKPVMSSTAPDRVVSTIAMPSTAAVQPSPAVGAVTPSKPRYQPRGRGNR